VNGFKFHPAIGRIFICVSLIYMALTIPGETASTAAVIRWAGMGLAIAVCGVVAMPSGVLAVLIERFKDESHASG
jgi:hypothetical protein